MASKLQACANEWLTLETTVTLAPNLSGQKHTVSTFAVQNPFTYLYYIYFQQMKNVNATFGPEEKRSKDMFQFYGDGVVRIKDTNRELDRYSLELRTATQNGLLLFLHDDVDKKIQVSYVLGDQNYVNTVQYHMRT